MKSLITILALFALTNCFSQEQLPVAISPNERYVIIQNPPSTPVVISKSEFCLEFSSKIDSLQDVIDSLTISSSFWEQLSDFRLKMINSLQDTINECRRRESIQVLISQSGNGNGYFEVKLLAQESRCQFELSELSGISIGDIVEFDELGRRHQFAITSVIEVYKNYARVNLSNVGVVSISSIPTVMGIVRKN